MSNFHKIVLAVFAVLLAMPMASAQETLENQPFNCRTTSTPPLVRLEGVAELAGDILIVCSGIVPNQGIDTTTDRLRDLRANITLNVDVPVTSQGIQTINRRIVTEALLIHSGDQGRCGDPLFDAGLAPNPLCVGPGVPAPTQPTGATYGARGQGAPYVGGAPVFANPYPTQATVSAKYNPLTINNHGRFPTTVGGGLSTFGTLEWDDVLLAPGSAAGRIWYMQMKITNVRVNAANLSGQGEFAPPISAIITLNTTTGTVPLTPDTVVIARPRPSFRIQSVRETRRNCDSPREVRQMLDIIEILPNAFKPRTDDEVNQGCSGGSADQCNPNTAYFTESGLMLDDIWATSAPTPGNTGVATQGTQFNIEVISPSSLDGGVGSTPTGSTTPNPYKPDAPYRVTVEPGWDMAAGSLSNSTVLDPGGVRMRTNSVLPVLEAGVTTLATGDIARSFIIEVDDFRLNADPFLINRLRVPVRATYNEQVFGSTTFRVWYAPLARFEAGEGIVQTATPSGATTPGRIAPPVPRFAPAILSVDGYAIVRCRTLLLFPYITNRNGYNTGIAISNTSVDNNAGPYDENPPGSTSGIARGANPQTGPCTLYLYGGNNGASNPVAQTPITSTVNVPAGGVYLMTLQTGGMVKGASGQDVGNVGGAPGFEGYAIASCEFQYAHGYAFISDTQVQRVAQGYLALIIPDRTYDRPSEAGQNWSDRPASPFSLGDGALLGGEQLVH